MFAKRKNSPNSKTQKPRASRARFWRKTHRVIGIYTVLFVLTLAISGLVLNHTDSLFKNKNFVKNNVLLDWYSIPPSHNVTAFRLEIHYFDAPVFMADGNFYLGERILFTDLSPPLGLFVYQDIAHLVTHSEVVLMSEAGELVERLPFPQTINTAYLAKETLILRSKTTSLLDLDSLSLSDPSPSFSATQSLDLNSTIAAQSSDSFYANIARKNKLTRTKVAQDIHSGRIFGKWGRYLFDIAGVCMIILSVSGFRLWLKRQ